MRTFTEDQVDAAMCIWEYSLHSQAHAHGIEVIFDWLRGGEGAASARQQCIELAKDCDASYQRAVTLGYSMGFDWDFVPRWVKLAMEISETHDLHEHWIEYIGIQIYVEFERNNRHVE